MQLKKVGKKGGKKGDTKIRSFLTLLKIVSNKDVFSDS